ncbi:multidrug resistance protein 1 [Auriculariales sp. MPI-PUGE-AT-0066]|nr:multidrug resistance protein 1 [Auriculariales sp. MPI-PUGE-AT-0066]
MRVPMLPPGTSRVQNARKAEQYFQSFTTDPSHPPLPQLARGTMATVIAKESEKVAAVAASPDAADPNASLQATQKPFWKRKSKEKTENAAEVVEYNAGEAQAFGKPQPGLPPVSFLALFRFSTPFERFLNIFGIVCAVAGGASQPLMTLLFGHLTQAFVDFGSAAASGSSDLTAAANHFRHVASETASFLVALGAGTFLITYVYMCAWTYTGEVQSKRIREKYLQAILRQDIAYFDKLGAGEVTTRIQTDCHLVQQGMSEKVALCASHVGAFCTGFILGYIQNWKLALAVSSIFPCFAIIGGLHSSMETKFQKRALDAVAESGSLAEEVISAVRTIQAFGSQSVVCGLYNKFVAKAQKNDSGLAATVGFGAGTFYLVMYSAYALAFYFGTTLLLKGQITAGEIVNVFTSIFIGSFAMAQLMPELEAISLARSAAAKLFETIDRVPEIDSADPGGRKLDIIEGRIAFEDVKFTYPSRAEVQVLKGMTLTLEAGKSAALVGASGSGKSTVVQLIERFYDVSEGRVTLDGVDIRELNVKWLRSQIGLVSQEPVLFATTIEANVAHGLIGTPWESETPERKQQLIREACVTANADSFIQLLPNGYETMVGERGFLLSGGQKQRIAIARAIVSNPKILLLDEATSALDAQSEGIVQDALDKASMGRMSLTVTHRLATIQKADNIYVVDSGEIVEQGTHEELLRRQDGAYSVLVAAQRLRESSPSGEDLAIGFGVRDSGQLAKLAEPEMSPARVRRQSIASSIGSVELATRPLVSRDAQTRKRTGFISLLSRMIRINKSEWKSYVLGCVGAIIAGLVYPSFSITYGYILNAYTQTDRAAIRRDGNRNALWFFIIGIGATIAVGSQNFFFARSGLILAGRLRRMMFKAMLRQDVEFFDRDENSTGVLTASLSEDPQKVIGMTGVTLGMLLQSLSTVVIGSIVGLAYGWKLALVAIACIPFVLFGGYVQLRLVVMKDEMNKQYHEESAQVACEAAAAIRTVVSLVREDDCIRIYSRSLEIPLQRSNRTMISRVALVSLMQASSFWVISLVFWYGSRLVASREYSIDKFFTVLMSITFASIQIFMWAPDISSAVGSAASVLKLLDVEPNIDAESTEGAVPKEVAGRVVFQDVHFRYPTRPSVKVLRGLDFTVEPGTFVALVGASGCGKSTVVQLTERFYDPLSGQVMLDGANVADLNVQEYRKSIAVVSQEPTLYHGTIKFNILLGAVKPHEQVTQEELELVCRDANILEFIQSLPDGFETQVGGKGSHLSGGQKQRIAIARALIRNPKVLLLDEATSALDSSSERVVQEALDKVARGRTTTIAIAHRLSTIQNADRIFFIKEGRVAEAGTHDQLIARGGDYAEYVRLQALSRVH